MRCSSCGAENPEGLRFCEQCAAPFKRHCAKCGFENSPAARFCGQCATALDGAAGTAASIQSARAKTPASTGPSATEFSAAETDGEHKTVTGLFADIKGSMELVEDLDPEEARAIVDPALKLMIEAVHRYDGHIVQSTGDGIFALFGAPISHEDHSQRALYAALRIQEEIRRYGDRMRVKGQAPLQVRIGVNSGEVVVRSLRTGPGAAEYIPSAIP